MPNVKIYINCKGMHCYFCGYQSKTEFVLDKNGGKIPHCQLFKTNLERSETMVLEENAWNKYQYRKFDILRCIACHNAEIYDPKEYPPYENMID